MLRHVILWQLKDELTGEEKQKIKQKIKDGLEALNGRVLGVERIEVHINGLPASTADVMLEVRSSESALAEYAADPEHQKVAAEKIRPFVKTKLVLDYPEE